MKDDEKARIRLRCLELSAQVYTQPHMRNYEPEESIIDYAEELANYAILGKRGNNELRVSIIDMQREQSHE